MVPTGGVLHRKGEEEMDFCIGGKATVCRVAGSEVLICTREPTITVNR